MARPQPSGLQALQQSGRPTSRCYLHCREWSFHLTIEKKNLHKTESKRIHTKQAGGEENSLAVHHVVAAVVKFEVGVLAVVAGVAAAVEGGEGGERRMLSSVCLCVCVCVSLSRARAHTHTHTHTHNQNTQTHTQKQTHTNTHTNTNLTLYLRDQGRERDRQKDRHR